MPVTYCSECHKYIDLDVEVEHFEDHMKNFVDNGEDQSEGFELIGIGASGNWNEVNDAGKVGRPTRGW